MEVARDLRIRHVYIEAIEAGRLDDLPGLAYQTGFMRAYGNYLGLDGAALAERLRTARDTTAQRAELQVFSPVDEGHLPTRSVLIIAALLAVAVYGVWYFVANTEGDPVERVAALPDRLVGLLDSEPETGADDAPTGEAAAPPPPPEPQRSARRGDSGGDGSETAVAARTEPVSPAPEPEPAPEPAAVTPEPEPTPAAVPPEPAPEPAASTPEPEPAAAPPPQPARPEPPEETESRTARVDEPPAVEEVAVAAPALPTPTPPPAEESVEAASAPPAETPEAETGASLVLRAVTDSWIEIRLGDAPPVYSGLLREGESYSVPRTEGLKMITGNAGGLEVLVDGRAIPRLGPPGAVMRDIDLDGLRRRESG